MSENFGNNILATGEHTFIWVIVGYGIFLVALIAGYAVIYVVDDRGLRFWLSMSLCFAGMAGGLGVSLWGQWGDWHSDQDHSEYRQGLVMGQFESTACCEMPSEGHGRIIAQESKAGSLSKGWVERRKGARRVDQRREKSGDCAQSQRGTME